MSNDLERRFGGVARLYGNEGACRLREAHVCIVGIGGVGSWVAEAMARNAVGEITLIDLDMVAESNTNRQIHALGEIFGKAKVDAMAERIMAINPACVVHCIEDFVTPDNVTETLGRGYSVVVDAIDQVKTKASMIAFCRQRKLPIIVAGAAGGQLDPTQIRIDDLSKTIQDPLLARLRSILRRDYGFSKDGKKKFGIPAVFSTEPLRYPQKDSNCDIGRGPSGLNCAGFGSSVCVTSVFGMAAAAHALNLLVNQSTPATTSRIV
ncbi:MAG: tRNA cyclic N6-threonylcarbamoyladenosine(37) synthase TcdA [Rhodocyclales bacterium GT-UBC]|nr:MAG: tRNA cyclic N6-threonylcarbamoyladenosine(37) synthase TcdA [Rhodocyclales bacterium GT-UBC]